MAGAVRETTAARGVTAASVPSGAPWDASAEPCEGAAAPLPGGAGSSAAGEGVDGRTGGGEVLPPLLPPSSIFPVRPLEDASLWLGGFGTIFSPEINI